MRVTRALLYEGPFWLAAAAWSILPSAATPWGEIGAVRMSAKELLLIGLATAYGIHALLRRRLVLRRRPWSLGIPTAFGGLVIYAGVSLGWSRLSPVDARGMLFTLVLGLAAMSLGFTVIAGRPEPEVRRFVWRIVVLLCACGLLYSAESFLGLGLRSDATRQWTDFGVQRVRGPLFGSATGHFILVPAFAYALQRLLEPAHSRSITVAVATGLAVTVLGLGSRAGLVVGLAFILLAIPTVQGLRRRIALIVAVVLVGAVAGTVVLQRATLERFRSFEDASRLETHATAIAMISSRPVGVSLVGSGYGSVWPWYAIDSDPEGPRATGEYVRSTDHGRILYHPHSVLLMLIVELGLIGLVFLVGLFCTLARALLHSRRLAVNQVYMAGVVASVVAVFFDLFLFKNAILSALWWILLFGSLRLRDLALRRRQSCGGRHAAGATAAPCSALMPTD